MQTELANVLSSTPTPEQLFALALVIIVLALIAAVCLNWALNMRKFWRHDAPKAANAKANDAQRRADNTTYCL